jgi:hypothetical protein
LKPGIGGHVGTGPAFNSLMFFLDFGFPPRPLRPARWVFDAASAPAASLAEPTSCIAMGTLARAIVAGKEFGPVNSTLSIFIDAHQETRPPTRYIGSLTCIKVLRELLA